MNMGCGSYHNPEENLNFWVPATREKPASQRSNNDQPEMAKSNQSGMENWNQLLGIYSGFLQNEESNAMVRTHIDQQEQQISNTIWLMGQNYSNVNVRNVSFAVSDHGPSQKVDLSGVLGLNSVDYNVRDDFSTDKGGILNQRANVFSENTQPQKVNSLADLLSVKNAAIRYPVHGLAPSMSSISDYVMSGPTGFNASHLTSYVSSDLMLNDTASHASHKKPKDRLMVSHWSNHNPKLLPSIAETSSSSLSLASHIVPIMPDQQLKHRHPMSDNKESHLLVNDTQTASREKNALVISSPSQSPQVLNNEHDKLSLISAPQDASSSSLKEKDEILEIDLNKSPQQKPPKRKKIRPKVVVEGNKPKSTPNKAKKTPPPKENVRPKRKYVRRKGVEPSAATPSIEKSSVVEVSNVVEASNVGPPRKSCRRTLNFDLNIEAEKEFPSEGSEHQQTGDYPESQVLVDLNLLSGDDANCTREFFGGVKVVEAHQEQMKMAAFESQGSSRSEFTNPPQPTPKNHMLMNIIARSLNVQSANANIYNHANDSEPNLHTSRRQPPLQITRNADVISHSELRQNQVHDPMRSTTQQQWSNEVFESGHSGNDNVIIAAESSIMHQNIESIYPEDKGQSSSRNKNAETSELARCWYPSSPQVHSSAELAQKTWSKPSKEQTISSIIAVTEPSEKSEITVFPNRFAVKKRTGGQASSKKVALMVKPVKKATKRSKGNSSKETCRSEEKNHTVSIEFITDRLKVLQIGTSGKELVPHGGDGAIVLLEPVKKRIPRPRVELDSETNRLWNLLMGKEGSENMDTMDADKQKWWDEERKVVRGRVDSFIARMHLVQGDRRFSKWKGSVVDSVIGVFLTQNVSDHLSSSAFMSLVSKFPAKLTYVSENSGNNHEVRVTFPDETMTQPASNHSSVTSVELSEHGTGEIVQDQTTFSIKHTSMLDEDIVSSHGSMGSCTVQNTEDIRSGSGSNSEAEYGYSYRRNTESVLSISKQAEVVDSQQSYQFQFNESSFPGNLMCHQEFQYPRPSTSNCVHSNAFISNDSYYQKSASYANSWTNLLLGMQSSESSVPTSSRKESESYLDTRDFINSRDGGEHASKKIGQSIECSVLGAQNRGLKHHQELNGWDFTNHIEGRMHESIVNEIASVTKPTEDSTESSRIQSDNQKQRSGHTTSTQIEAGQVNETNNTATNTRKRKAEKKEKAEPINWDTLRTRAESDAGVRRRTYENMDSLDYEALQNSEVSEISNTIKERGMNNMLAVRIKDFLERLERDHGKVDLEWLRDVPPDKAKDYLLSMKGLGLKSVECVRLLTLHHLAFPVDTNVGRIAVRLGWVPLQPLPESLQLHLLEMYPVLESIQKYLWPRLCKLDQETLYELHYQMITFGKVFCTKRDPNCNACPMRAECRHFASAFASARLTLPAPEERRIVTSAGPVKNDNKGPVELTKPMLLTPVEGNSETRTGFSIDCEPLIEEPKTPEHHVELLERDIEDFYYEDPDEIPVIKLNVEEFATNLQNFMQEKMDIGEADVSKALVALSPALASIPMPKLKNISRLRTEHQVYELPDSHPLLKEMNRREPDDPSPYLLAIWTPGETADSVTPPEITCSSRGVSGTCNNEMCFSCNSAREAQAQTVRGTILIPCRTAMRGSFPLNGTYFQVNEVFADHDSSLNPIDVPRSLLWNLPRRTVFFGTSVSTIFKGMSTEDIQFCFWKGFVCVRGFDQKTRAPRPLVARLHFPASKMAKKNE